MAGRSLLMIALSRLALAAPLALASLAACARTPPGAAAPPIVVTVAELPADAGAPSAPRSASGAASSARAGSLCAFAATAGPLEPSSPSCTLYEEISRGGRVLVPCDPTSETEATAIFGEHEYRGTARAGYVRLEHTFELDERDGCRWRIRARLEGTPASGTLAWSYAEEVLEDDVSNCWGTCTARTEVSLAPVR